MNVLKSARYLDDVLSKHFEVGYTKKIRTEDENGAVRYTPSIATVDLQFTDKSGVIKNAATISVFSFGLSEAELVYSAWLGWREERKETGSTTLDMIDLYTNMLLKHGSHKEVEHKSDELVRASAYQFFSADYVEFSPSHSDNLIITRTDLFHESVYDDINNIPAQRYEVIKINSDLWWDYHLGIKSIHDDWDELYKEHVISTEELDKIYNSSSESRFVIQE